MKQPQQANGTVQLYACDANQLRNSNPYHLFSCISFITFESTHFGQKHRDTERQAPPVSWRLGVLRLGYHPKKFAPVFPILKKVEWSIGGGCV
jgi:hypothetical protein